MSKKVISIIPARQGSKRFVDKNTSNFCNFPLALWTFHFSQNCDLFDFGYVNTDIADLKVKIDEYDNLEYCEREKDLSTDRATLLDVIRDTCIKKSLSSQDIIVLLPVTGVLRTYNDIASGIDAFIKGNGETIVSVSKSSYPAGMLWKLDDDSTLNPLFPKEFGRTTQKQNHFSTFMFNDLFVIDSVGGFLNPDRNLYGEKTKALLVSPDRFMPIDYEYQFFLAEKLFELGQKSGVYPIKC